MSIELANLNSDFLVRKATSPSRETSDGNMGRLWGARDGALVGADWYTALALEGRSFIVDTAAGSDPDTFNATYGAAEPDLYLHVPKGKVVIPVYIEVGFEDTGSAQVMDVFALASSTEEADLTVTGTAETISSLRTDEPYKSACSAWSVVTGNLTNPMAGNYYEFWRPYMGFADDAFDSSIPWRNQKLHGASWSVKKAGVPPVVCDSGAIAIWASAQAGTGFITLIWVEFDSEYIT